MRKSILVAIVGMIALTSLVSPADARERAWHWCSVGGVVAVVSGLSVAPDIQASYPTCTVTVYYAGLDGAQPITSISRSSNTVTVVLGVNSTTLEANSTVTLSGTAYDGTYQINAVTTSSPATFTFLYTGAATGSGSSGTATILPNLYSDNSGTVLSNPFSASNKGYWFFYADDGRYDVTISGGNPALPAPFTFGDIELISPATSGALGGIEVNGSPTTNSSAPYFGNFNGTNPAAPGGAANVIFQHDNANPENISGYVSAGTTTPYIQLPSSTFACGSGNTSLYLSNPLCTMNIAALAQGNTAQSPFIAQPSHFSLNGPPFVGNTAALSHTAALFPTDCASGCTSLSESWPNNYQTSGATDDTMIVEWIVQNPAGMDPCSAGGSFTDNKGDVYSTQQRVGAWGFICVGYAFGVPAGVTTVTLANSGGGAWQDGEVFMMEALGPTSLDSSGGYANINQTPPQSASVTTTAANDFVVEIGSNSADTSHALQCYPTSLTADNLSQFAELDHPCLGSGATLFATYETAIGQLGSASTYTQHTNWYWDGTNGYDRNIFFILAFKAAGSATTAIPYWYNLNPSASGNTVPEWVQTVQGWTGLCVGTQSLLANGTCATGFVNPMTTLGDVIYGGASGAATRLAGNTTTNTYCFIETGTGSAANAPTWNTCPGATSGVTSLNSLTGALSLVAGSNITITPSGSNITIAASGGGASLPSASSNLKTAAPVQITGSTVVYSPDPTICAGGTSITNCSPQRNLIAGHMYVAGFIGGEGIVNFANCNLSDSLSNTWTKITVDNTHGIGVWWTIVANAGADTITLSSGCNTSGTSEQTLGFIDVPNGGTIDATGDYGPDSCGNLSIKCSASVTTTQPADLVLDLVSVANNSTIGVGQLTIAPQGNLWANSASIPSYNFSALAAPTAGTYTVTAVDQNIVSPGYTYGVLIAITPASPLVGAVSVTTGTTGSFASITPSLTSGNTVLVMMHTDSGMTSGSTCTVSDTLSGTVWSSANVATGVKDWAFFGKINATGTDTISFGAGCDDVNGSGHPQLSAAQQIAGQTYQLSGNSGSLSGSTVEYSIAPTLDSIFIGIPTDKNSDTITWSPGLDVLASSSGATIAYSIATGHISLAYGPITYGATYSACCNTQGVGGWLLVPNAAATYPQQPRVTQLADLGAPVTTLTLPFAASETFNAAQAHGWDISMTANITATLFVGGVDAQAYFWTFCANSGGPYTVAQPTNVNVTNWPSPSIPASSCVTFHATYDGATATLVFPPNTLPLVVYSTVATAGTSSISATTMATAGAGGNTYRASFYVDVTIVGVACTGATTVAVNAIYTDPNASSATTALVGTFSITSNSDLGTVGDSFSAALPMLRAKASTNVQFSTTYTAGSGCSTDPTVQVAPVLEQLK